MPSAVTLPGSRAPVAVAAVADEWLVEDEWWRAPVARHYRRLLLADGRTITAFEDRIAGVWYLQPYALGGIRDPVIGSRVA